MALIKLLCGKKISVHSMVLDGSNVPIVLRKCLMDALVFLVTIPF